MVCCSSSGSTPPNASTQTRSTCQNIWFPGYTSSFKIIGRIFITHNIGAGIPPLVVHVEFVALASPVIYLEGRRWSWGPLRLKEQLLCLTGLPWSTVSKWAPTAHVLKWLKHKTAPTPSAGEDVEQQELLIHHWWECRVIQPLWKIVCQFFAKRNMSVLLPCDPAIIPWCLPKGADNLGLYKNLHSDIYSSFTHKL